LKMTHSGRFFSMSVQVSNISLTLDSQPGVAMTSSAMVLSHSKRSLLMPAGRMATDGQDIRREI